VDEPANKPTKVKTLTPSAEVLTAFQCRTNMQTCKKERLPEIGGCVVVSAATAVAQN